MLLTEIRDNAVKEIFDTHNPDADRYFIIGFDCAHDLMAFNYMAMVNALKQINQEELNSQRPGGGHSRSATLSYEALKLVGEM
jgi:hypothetical protein